MTINFPCDECGQRYTVDETLAGKRIKCKQCENVIRIPDQAASGRPTPGSRPLVPRARATKVDDDFDQPEFLPEHEGTPEPVLATKPIAASWSKPSNGWFEDPTTRNAIIAVGGVGGVILVVLIGWAMLRGGNSVPSSPASNGGLQAHEAALKESIAAVDELSSQFESIQDDTSARSSAPVARATVEQLGSIARRILSLPRLTGVEQAHLKSQYNGQMNASLGRFRRELHRIEALPGVAEALQDLTSISLPT
jgi:hypothetical protein